MKKKVLVRKNFFPSLLLKWVVSEIVKQLCIVGFSSRTRVDVAGGLTLSEAVSLAQSMAVGVTPRLNCRIPQCELDAAFFILCIAFPVMHLMLSLIPSHPRQQAGVENSATVKEHFLQNVRNFGIVGTYVGPSGGSMKCAQFGFAPDDASSLGVRRELFSPHYHPLTSFM